MCPRRLLIGLSLTDTVKGARMISKERRTSLVGGRRRNVWPRSDIGVRLPDAAAVVPTLGSGRLVFRGTGIPASWDCEGVSACFGWCWPVLIMYLMLPMCLCPWGEALLVGQLAMRLQHTIGLSAAMAWGRRRGGMQQRAVGACSVMGQQSD